MDMTHGLDEGHPRQEMDLFEIEHHISVCTSTPGGDNPGMRSTFVSRAKDKADEANTERSSLPSVLLAFEMCDDEPFDGRRPI